MNDPTREFLSFQDIEAQYPGTVKAHTAAVWKTTNRYGFRDIVTMIGGKPRVRRDRWESFLDQRTGIAA
jgi:hypothetical protein